MKIVLETIVENLSTRVDGTMKLTISTNEIDHQTAGNLFLLRGKFCKMLLSDTNITKLEEEAVDSTQLVHWKKNKTESQRLRNVLFRYCEQQNGDFEQFYKSEMDRIIEHYKSKLE